MNDRLRYPIFVLIFFASLFIFTAVPALATKDCRSRLSSGLNALGSTGLFWNLELRGFYYRVGDSDYAFPGLGTWLRYEPSKNWSLDFEIAYKKKILPEYKKEVKTISPIHLKTALFRYQHPEGKFNLSLGRQEVQLANGLIMDEFLDALHLDFQFGSFELRAGAGVLALSVAKEALSCSKCLFFEYRSCWKGFCDSNYGDFKTGYIQASASLNSKVTAGLLYQKVAAAEKAYDSDLAGIFIDLNLPFRWRTSIEGAMQKLSLHEALAFGYYASLYRSWRIGGVGTLQVRFQDLYGSAKGSVIFSPIFGNLHLGDRQHYSVRQGHTSAFGLKLTPEFYKRLTINASYLVNARKDWFSWTTDEIDIGFEWRPFGTDLGRFYAGYARAFTKRGFVHQLALETRISF